MTNGLSRREYLAALLFASQSAPAWAQSKSPRVAILDWGLTTSVLSLGIIPAGVAEIELYHRWADDFPVPSGVQDVGLRTEPNLEVLAALKPDVIITTPFSEGVRPMLERIAPTHSYATYTPAGQPLNRSIQVLREIAEVLKAQKQAEDVIARAEETFISLRRALEGRSVPPLLLAGFMDSRHARIYGQESLFGNVLDRLGLQNAWKAPTNFWGFSLVGTHELAPFPDAQLFAIEPIPADAPLSRSGSGLWQSMPFVRAGSVAILPTCWAFGDVSTALRFARSLTNAILNPEGSHAS